MKKNFGIYAIVWTLCLAVFNVIVFVTLHEIDDVSKFTGTFWVGYIFITVAFIGALVCSYVALGAKDLKKTFYNLPLLSVGITGLVFMTVAASVFMWHSELPIWIGLVICLLILLLNIIAVAKAVATASFVSHMDETVKSKTLFVKALTADADVLLGQVKSEALKALCQEVRDALRYADPMSHASLEAMEEQIKNQFTAFSEAVALDDLDLATALSADLSAQIAQRNEKCKLLK